MDGFGNAVLEAMSFGCPALVSRFGASHEVVGDTAFIINSITPSTIAETLLKFISYSIKDRHALRFTAFQRAHSEFSFHKTLTSFRKIIADSFD